MSVIDRMNQNLAVLLYQLTPEQVFEARENRNWDLYSQLEEREKLQHRLEELDVYSHLIEDLSEEEFYNMLRNVRNY